MKFAKLMTVVCAAAMLSVVGCNKDNKANAGAVKGDCCKEASGCTDAKKANMGATSGKTGCCKEAAKANMGAVQNKSECTTKTECTDKKANMGAVAPKSGCCASKKTN